MTRGLSLKIEDHPGFQKGSDVLSLAQSFFGSAEVKYFGIGRLFDDDRFSFGLSDQKVSKIQFLDFKEPVALSRLKPEERKDTFLALEMDRGVSVGLEDSFVRTLRNETSLKHSAFVTKRFTHYTDMFFLSLADADTDPSNFYYAHSDKIKLLFHHLYDRGSLLLKEIFASTIEQEIGSRVSLEGKNIEIKPPKQFTFLSGGKGCHLTPTEYEILTLLTQGYSGKMIAKLRNISPRTVESHLEKIKMKTGLRFKDDLAFWFNAQKS